MASSEPIRAKGPTHYDLLGMGPGDFEQMSARLIRLEFPNAVKPGPVKDGGADMVLPRSDGPGYERAWQSKHFKKGVPWAKCEKSLAAAVKNWPEISEYTFVFPRELTHNEQMTFDEKFRTNAAKVNVKQWNGAELQARLADSDEGRRVAKTFFADVELDREEISRAIEVGGRLNTAEDALDRMQNVGGFLASRDAYFSYPSSTHEAGGAAPSPTPGSVLSIGKTEGEITSRIDVVPRDDEALEEYGPALRFDPQESEAGNAAAASLEEALREGKSVEIGEGLDVTFTRMPPALQDIVGKRLTGGRVILGEPEKVRPRVEPFRARLEAKSDQGAAHIDVELRQLDEVPEGWDDAFVAEYGGVTITELARRVGDRGEIRWNFTYRRDRSLVKDQLAALRLMSAFSGTGEFSFTRLTGVGGESPALTSPTQPRDLGPEIRDLTSFLEDVRAIEEWADREFELPDVLSVGDQVGVKRLAARIRAGGVPVTWSDFELVIDEAGVRQLREGGVIRVEREVSANVFGSLIPLGLFRLDLAGFEVVEAEPTADDPELFNVRIEPRDEKAARAFEALTKETTKARPKTRRPPPPPRKGKGRGRGKRGRR